MDLKKKVFEFMSRGGGKMEASRIFGLDPKTIYNWRAAGLEALSAQANVVHRRHRKLDKGALAAHVRAHPDALLRERAVHFGVHVNAIWEAFKVMGISKKNDAVR